MTNGGIPNAMGGLKQPGWVLLWLVVGWFTLLGFTGTLTSGFHFTDDHEVYSTGQDVKHSSVMRELRILKREIISPEMRFRPLYHMTRRWTMALLGENFLAWSILYGLLAVFTSFFLYLFMKQLAFSFWEALFFSIFTLLGAQAAIWWKLGANESIGMLMLAITLYFMARWVTAKQKKTLYLGLFLLFALLMSWSKESFVLVLPVLAVWPIWLSCHQKQTANPGSWPADILFSIRKNLLPGIILIVLCGVQLYHIVAHVGTTGVQYAGYEGFLLHAFVKTAFSAFHAVWGWVLFVELGLLVWLFWRQAWEDVLNVVVPVILMALFFLPQVALYMKSGMTERYLLPGVVGLTFLMVSWWREIRLKTNKETPGKFSLSWSQWVMVIVLGMMFLMQLRVTRYTAMAFARDGRDTNGWINSILTHRVPQDMVLVVTHIQRYYEPSFALKTLLTVKGNQDYLLFAPPSLDIKVGDAGFWRVLNARFWYRFPRFKMPQGENENAFQMILLFPQLEQDFLKAAASWFKPSQYDRYTNDSGLVHYYLRKH